MLKDTLFKLTNLYQIEPKMVEKLYQSSRISLVGLLLALFVTSIVLYSRVELDLWIVVTYTILLIRLYYVYTYTKDKIQSHTYRWYIKFLILSLMAAWLISFLGFYFILQVDRYFQLFIVAILLGISSATYVPLRHDIRIAIAYTSIIFIPLIFSLLFLDTGLKNYALSFLLAIYYLGLIGALIKHYQNEKQYKNANFEKNQLKNIFEEAPLGIFSYNNELKIVDANKQISNIFQNDKISSYENFDLRTLKDKNMIKVLEKTLLGGAQTYKGHYYSLKDKDYWVHVNCFPYRDKDGNVIGAVGILEDKTKEHKARKKLEFLSTHDVLTPLLNRRGFIEYIEKLVQNPQHEAYYSLLFYLDLNQFKGINDSLGHAVGDEILLAIAGRLLGLLGNESTICRLGGDEFVVVVSYVAHEKSYAELEADNYAKKILSVFDDYFVVNNIHLYVKSSIGIVLIEPEYTNTKEIIRRADMSMYQAKHTYKDVVFYNEEIDQKQKDLFALQHDLAFAIQKNEFELFYQPIYSLEDDRIHAAEMLLRWKHPDHGELSPDTFIPLATKAGLLSNITWWILEKICEDIDQWKKEGKWNLNYVSINVSAQQLVENNFTKKFIDILEKYKLDTHSIVVEITEQSLIDNFEYAQNIIDSLRINGIRCSIDDFGTGYSSLSYLKKLSFDTLKIDKEFIQEETEDKVLLSSIFDIAKYYHYNIIVEGVENESQKVLLKSFNHKIFYQGYLISKPLKKEIFVQKFLT